MPPIKSDLHVHLYGCLTAQDLWDLIQQKQGRDWNRFEMEWKRQFGSCPDMKLLTHPDLGDFSAFKELYSVRSAVSFPQFQAHFNMIIACVDLHDLQQIQSVTQKMVKRHCSEGLQHVEYRMLFPPWIESSLFSELISILCKVLFQEEVLNPEFQGRFSLGLPRTDPHGTHYQWLRALMRHNSVVATMTTSIDFCSIEEGFPPQSQAALLQQISQDNQKLPQSALAVLYHVGEVFSDKSLESAIRWIHEVAELGAHRLGHALALGIAPESYLKQKSVESVAERLNQITYDFKYAESLKEFGVFVDFKSLQEEEKTLLSQSDSQALIRKPYTQKRVQELRCRQDYVMEYLKQMNVCIESCPTSNHCIGNLGKSESHPLFRFLDQGLPVVLGTDDPGIFETSIAQEIDFVTKQCFENEIDAESFLEVLQNNAQKYRSEILSGREQNPIMKP